MQSTQNHHLIESKLLQRKREIDAFLTKLLSAKREKIVGELSRSPSVIKILDAMEYSLSSGGKRMRAFLVLEIADIMTHNIAHGNMKIRLHPEQEEDVVKGKEDNGNIILMLAAAIELVHCYSLIHDDLPAMDDDDYRRSGLSCHRQYDEATAILAGDALLTMAFEVLAEINPAEMAIKAIRILSKASGCRGMIAGQMIDIDQQLAMIKGTSSSAILGQSDLYNLNRLKTGSLYANSSMFGGLAAGLKGDCLQHLWSFGECLGILYQMADDVEDDGASVDVSILTHLRDRMKSDIVAIEAMLAHGISGCSHTSNTPGSGILSLPDIAKYFESGL